MNLKLHLRFTCVLHEIHTVDINNIQYAYMHVILQFWTVYAVAWEDAFTGSLEFAQVQLCTVTVHCMWSDEMNLPIIFLQTQTSSLKVSWVLTYFIFKGSVVIISLKHGLRLVPILGKRFDQIFWFFGSVILNSK